MNEPSTSLRCFQCDAHIADGSGLEIEVSGVTQTVCCSGCRATVEKVQGLDLENFYDFREKEEHAPAGHRDVHPAPHVDFESCVTSLGSGSRLSVIVPDIRCAACTWLIENGLQKLDGVRGCKVNLSDKRVLVDFEELDVPFIVDFIEQLGYTVHPDRSAEIHESIRAERKALLARLGVAGIGMMQVMMFALAGYVAGDQGIEPAYESLMRWASLAIATPIALYSASPFHLGAWRDLSHRIPGMDVPVSLAILAAYLLSTMNTLSGTGEVYFDSVCMFTFFLLIGRYVELRSRQRYQESQNLSDSLLPSSARLSGPEETFVPVDKIKPGDVVRVLPGEQIPVDGRVMSGETSASEIAFTGEAAPVVKGPGTSVLAGSENLDGEILVRAEADYDDFVITRISKLFRESTAYKPAFSLLADRIARYFVTFILLLAAGSALFWYFVGAPDWMVIGLTVLVVSCPCALSLATPVAYTVATSAMRNIGVVISDGAFLERVARVNRVIFDKTGTLTRGHFRIERVASLDDTANEDYWLKIAVALERGSKHPLARAFDLPSDLEANNVEVVPGRGVTGEIAGHAYRLGSPDFAWKDEISVPGETGVWILLAGDRPLAWICLRDEDRSEAPGVVQWLDSYGLAVDIVTGDASGDGDRLGRKLNVGRVFSAMKPDEKAARVRDYQSGGDYVLMVGDGINDAVAMGAANASIAVTPVDVFLQSAADATMVNANLEVLPRTVAFAHKTRRVIRQNIGWAIAYNICVIPLAVTGMILPWMAALGMSASSLIVVLNANRLFRVA